MPFRGGKKQCRDFYVLTPHFKNQMCNFIFNFTFSKIKKMFSQSKILLFPFDLCKKYTGFDHDDAEHKLGLQNKKYLITKLF